MAESHATLGILKNVKNPKHSPNIHSYLKLSSILVFIIFFFLTKDRRKHEHEFEFIR